MSDSRTSSKSKINFKPKTVYQDRNIVVFHKPAGMTVYGEGVGLKEWYEKVAQIKLYPVHRLDKPTEGIVVFAKEAHVASSWLRQFETRGTQKTYIALVMGELKPQKGKITIPLRKSSKEPSLQAITQYHVRKVTYFDLKNSNSKSKGHVKNSSKSNYDEPEEMSETGESVGLLDSIDSWQVPITTIELYPETGRYHQLRKHLKLSGAAILGDDQYSTEQQKRIEQQLFGKKLRLCLCATGLALRDPVTRKQLKLETKATFLGLVLRKS